MTTTLMFSKMRRQTGHEDITCRKQNRSTTETKVLNPNKEEEVKVLEMASQGTQTLQISIKAPIPYKKGTLILIKKA